MVELIIFSITVLIGILIFTREPDRSVMWCMSCGTPHKTGIQPKCEKCKCKTFYTN